MEEVLIMYKEIIINNRQINIFDDIFTLDERIKLYSFCRNSSFKIGWEDLSTIEVQNLKYLYCTLTPEEYNKLDFQSGLARSKKIDDDLLDNMRPEKCVINLSCPTNGYLSHTHPHKKVVLYYANLQWREEGAGDTLFFDEQCKEVLFTSAYVPGRVIIFDGKIPHTIRAQSSLAPDYRFSITSFWH